MLDSGDCPWLVLCPDDLSRWIPLWGPLEGWAVSSGSVRAGGERAYFPAVGATEHPGVLEVVSLHVAGEHDAGLVSTTAATAPMNRTDLT